MYFFWQLRVKVYDPATPSKAAYADYTIFVIRNLNPPQIPQDSYAVTLYDVDPVGMRVIMINATDNDYVRSSSGSSFMDESVLNLNVFCL